MPFPFVYVCDLLDDLSRLVDRETPLLPKDVDHKTTETTLRWLKLHRGRLDAAATDDHAVILTLQPEKRTDRVYGLDAFGLEQVVARVLNLPRPHHRDMQTWRHQPAKGDLASCVERVMENMNAENHHVVARAKVYAVTVEEIDESLLRIASGNMDSSAEVRSLASPEKTSDAIDILGDIYQRLTSREAKWLTRLILKDYSPVKFPESLICQSNHSFLPRCVQVHAQFASSIPAALRREGPGSLRLADAAISANKPLSTLPAIAPELVSAASHKTSPGTILSQSPSTRAEVSVPRSIANQILPAPKRSEPTTSLAFIRGAGKCLLTEQTCPLSNCLFITAPCVATTPWLIENLLPWHGVSYAISLRAFSDPSIPGRCSRTGKKYRKIALVETNRPEKTVEFLKKIGNLNLKTRLGEKQWVEVYDWRILECIAKIDQGKQLAYDPWRRCWIGAV